MSAATTPSGYSEFSHNVSLDDGDDVLDATPAVELFRSRYWCSDDARLFIYR